MENDFKQTVITKKKKNNVEETSFWDTWYTKLLYNTIVYASQAIYLYYLNSHFQFYCFLTSDQKIICTV